MFVGREKEYPYKTAGTKKTIYKLFDTMFQSWYRFVPLNRSLIERGAAESLSENRESNSGIYGICF